MNVPGPLVRHISDTARWVAVYRAAESERPDALFRDPMAARFAGERGREIAAGLPQIMRRHSWPMVLRTKVVDDLLLAAVGAGSDRVLDLAAGFDTRPYRLALPAALEWVEADLPALVDEKNRALARETPRCRVSREPVDLSDARARGAFLDRALEGASSATVVTEGLLVYLTDRAVEDLARDLAARPAVGRWIFDLVSPAVLAMMRRQIGGRFSLDAEMRFAPARGAAFFAPFGWKIAAVRWLLREAFRARRLPLLLQPLALLPDPDPTDPGRRPWSAVVMLERA